MPGQLEQDNVLKAKLDAILAGPAISKGAREWYSDLTAFLAEVKNASRAEVATPSFLKKVFDENPVASTGMGSVKVAGAIDNAEFRDWFASELTSPLPVDPAAAEGRLVGIYNQARDALAELCNRTPRLKLNRVLCSFYPEHFTTIADVGALCVLHEEMGGNRMDHPVHAHKAIRSRIDAVLGPVVESDQFAHVKRMCLPWYLFESLDTASSSDQKEAPPATPLALNPRPATLRRKGLTAMRGNFQALLGFLPELEDGVTREEFGNLMRQANPGLAAGSIPTAINVVAREFDLCRIDGTTYRLSARGLNLLESQDPDVLADHLLTRILGVDHVLKTLQRSPQTRAHLIAMLQRVNPGWTADYIPSAMLVWLSSLDVIVTVDRQFQLTERGRNWADQITWEPEFLPKPAETIAEVKEAMAGASMQIPAFQQVTENLQKLAAGKIAFDPSLVRQLHAGLWFHPVRHFAVLTGISGSGKTQLALKYAQALCGTDDEDKARVVVVPVQPGWYDPSPLLGYPSSIQESTYRGAPFLDLLLRAAADPERPYVAILDELNLSHPEQYLAPVLSVMETQGWLDLHSFSDETMLYPARVRYPANLAILGTLNMDETTHGLSDKVLDRAFTLEFWNIDVAAFPGWSTTTLPSDLRDRTRAVLVALAEALKDVRLHFGYRTIDDVLGYLTFHSSLESDSADTLDQVIYAKVLPKLRGENSAAFVSTLRKVEQILSAEKLNRCRDKVLSMQRDVEASGAARFWR